MGEEILALAFCLIAQTEADGTCGLKKPKTPEHRRKLSEVNKIRSIRPKTCHEPCSEDTKDKLRQANLGRKHTPASILKMQGRTPWNKNKSTGSLNQMHRENISLGNIGKIRSKEHRKHYSEAASNRPIIECPHCGKRGASSQMKRWHFDRCKTLKSIDT